MVSVCGGMARYLYGASTLRHRSLMGNYALQWAAMRLARERGCRSYDLYGIAPSADGDHPWAGLYRFKTGFGGAVVHRCGCWDYAVRPISYRLFRRAEVLRRDYYARLRPRLAGMGLRVEVTNTVMQSLEDKRALARTALNLAKALST